jgi:hypothetical protein
MDIKPEWVTAPSSGIGMMAAWLGWSGAERVRCTGTVESVIRGGCMGTMYRLTDGRVVPDSEVMAMVQARCCNGCDAPPKEPSKVLCAECLDKLDAKMRAVPGPCEQCGRVSLFGLVDGLCIHCEKRRSIGLPPLTPEQLFSPAPKARMAPSKAKAPQLSLFDEES